MGRSLEKQTLTPLGPVNSRIRSQTPYPPDTVSPMERDSHGADSGEGQEEGVGAGRACCDCNRGLETVHPAFCSEDVGVDSGGQFDDVLEYFLVGRYAVAFYGAVTALPMAEDELTFGEP